MAITQTQLARLQHQLSTGHSHLFYTGSAWQRMRQCVLDYDRHECQLCKAHGRYRRAVLVHHVKHLDARPDLALSLFDPETGERQLLSLCKSCHESQHPEALRPFQPSKPPLTLERWD